MTANRIARVVLGNTCLNFADQIGADVSRLGVDAAFRSCAKRATSDAPKPKPTS